MTDTAHHHAKASALAVALERLGLDPYASIARSETTGRAIDAFERVGLSDRVCKRRGLMVRG